MKRKAKVRLVVRVVDVFVGKRVFGSVWVHSGIWRWTGCGDSFAVARAAAVRALVLAAGGGRE